MSNNALQSIKEQMKKELATLRESVPAPGGRNISTKGKVFTMPDGKTNQGPLRAVILDHRNMNRYFTGAYNPNDIQPPLCFALGKELNLKPHPEAREPQAENCHECPHNQWGSAPNGGKGKACRNQVRLAIAAPDMTAEDEPYILTVSPTALRSWAALVSNLEVHGMLPIQVVTEIAFDANAAYPTLTFKATEPHDALETMWALREKAQPLLNQPPSGNN